MLNILTYFGYSLVAFGVGGIMFKDRGAKEILQQFNIFKKEKNNEIVQISTNKDTNLIQVQELSKDNSELNKLYNRSLRNIELKDLELTSLQGELEVLAAQEKASRKPGKAEKESFDDFLNNK